MWDCIYVFKSCQICYAKQTPNLNDLFFQFLSFIFSPLSGGWVFLFHLIIHIAFCFCLCLIIPFLEFLVSFEFNYPSSLSRSLWVSVSSETKLDGDMSRNIVSCQVSLPTCFEILVFYWPMDIIQQYWALPV